ncbi:MAG: hypothetical protein FJ215_00860 [Ignavibacteria bacterium]|nr:hypothetical protein [Ignavibacteria bacterium]
MIKMTTLRFIQKTLPLILIVTLTGTSHGQIRATKIQKVEVGSAQEWGYPRFSPDGRSIYFTTASYDGIWNYDISSRRIKQITADAKSGYGFTISQDGRRLAYRKTTVDRSTKTRLQEIVVVNLIDEKSETIRSSESLSVPLFVEGDVISSGDIRSPMRPTVPGSSAVVVGGIEDTKIVLYREGRKELFDPFGNGRYIWPLLSPRGDRIVAYEMSRGTFVSDLSGIVLAQLGRRNAPSWTRDGRWIVYMDDRDDGHRIVSSDIMAISPDGKQVARLTSTGDQIELFPSCSPIENKIVYATLRGEIYLLTYEEGPR